MWHLSTAASPTDAQLLAPAHLAALMLSEVAQSREVAAEKGEARGGAGRGVVPERSLASAFLLA